MMKIVKESLNEEPLNEGIKLDGIEYKMINYKGHHILVNKNGILGHKDIFIPWSVLEKIKNSL